MSVNEAGADHSTTEMTSAGNADHSESPATTSDTTNDSDFQRSIDEDWGLAEPEEPAEESEEADELIEEAPEDEEPGEEEPEETEEPGSEEDPSTETPEQEPFTLHVNHMGQGYDLPEDEARKYAQIGMNAGLLQEKYSELKPLEALREPIEILALFEGRPVDEVIRSFGDVSELRKREIASLVADGHDENLAAELFDSRYEEARQKRELNRMKSPAHKEMPVHIREQIDRFARFRPGEHEQISAGKPIPEDVMSEWRNGTDLTTAWLLHENSGYVAEGKEKDKRIKELEKELKTAKSENSKLRKNAENKQKAPTRKKGTGGGVGSGEDIYAAWSKF